MRTGKWRDAGIACAVVLAWHLMLGWVLRRPLPIDPSPAGEDAIQVVFIESRVAPTLPRVSTPVPRHPQVGRRTPLVAITRPSAAEALPGALPSQSMSTSAVILDQAGADAERPTPIDFSARDTFADRPKQWPTHGAERFRMLSTRSPKDMLAAVGGYLLAPRGYDADPCPRNRENIGNLMAAGDGAALLQEIDFERRHCRP